MPENKNDAARQAQPQPEGKKGAFGKDQQFGNRLDQFFAMGEPFLLLGAVIEEETIDTKFGKAEVAKLLCQKLNPDTGGAQGPPIKCNTVASAIVEKAKELSPEELAAGPVVHWQIVHSKARGTNAMVLSWIRNLADEEDYSEFGVDRAEAIRVSELSKPAGERINF